MADHGQPPPARVPAGTLERPCVRTRRQSDGSCRYEKEMRPREGSPMPEVTQQFNGTAGVSVLVFGLQSARGRGGILEPDRAL